jgi:hypothetical protein
MTKGCRIWNCTYKARTNGKEKCLLMAFHFNGMDEYLDYKKYGEIKNIPEECPYILELTLQSDKETDD